MNYFFILYDCESPLAITLMAHQHIEVEITYVGMVDSIKIGYPSEKGAWIPR